MRPLLILTLGSLLLQPDFCLAQMYRWQDERGIVYYSNAPERAARFPAETATSAAPAMSPAAETLPARGSARIPFTPGAPILVRARIADSGPVVLMLDTGADRTMVAPQVLARLGISTAGAPRAEIKGVTGIGYGSAVYVRWLEVGDARIGPLRIIAHDAELSRADGLLGRDFLEHFTVTIDARERVVTLAPR